MHWTSEYWEYQNQKFSKKLNCVSKIIVIQFCLLSSREILHRLAKGQIMLECIYEIIVSPKYHRKNFDRFLPWKVSRECLTYLIWIFSGQKSIEYFSVILENRWFHKYILTSSDMYCTLHQFNFLRSWMCRCRKSKAQSPVFFTVKITA